MAEAGRSSESQSDPLAVRGVRHRRQRFQERARMEYLQGAEQESRRHLGRGLTAEELELVLRLYPGEVW
jgi:hypothetical protein